MLCHLSLCSHSSKHPWWRYPFNALMVGFFHFPLAFLTFHQSLDSVKATTTLHSATETELTNALPPGPEGQRPVYILSHTHIDHTHSGFLAPTYPGPLTPSLPTAPLDPTESTKDLEQASASHTIPHPNDIHQPIWYGKKYYIVYTGIRVGIFMNL